MSEFPQHSSSRLLDDDDQVEPLGKTAGHNRFAFLSSHSGPSGVPFSLLSHLLLVHTVVTAFSL